MIYAVVFAGILALIPIAAVWHTFVVSMLWTWFVTPYFGLVVPGFALLYGLLLFVRLAFPNHSPFQPDDEHKFDRMRHQLGVTFLAPLVVLIVGFFVKGFV